MSGNIKYLSVCVAFVLCAFASVASARTIYVPDDYAKIQWAVDNASAGDTIIVRDGIYYESITVSRQLTIKSEKGPANCIVNGTGSIHTQSRWNKNRRFHNHRRRIWHIHSFKQ